MSVNYSLHLRRAAPFIGPVLSLVSSSHMVKSQKEKRTQKYQPTPTVIVIIAHITAISTYIRPESASQLRWDGALIAPLVPLTNSEKHNI